MVATNEQATQILTAEPFSVVGTRPARHDGPDKVTGRAQFGADLNLPGMLHGKVLRSPHAHARIRSIDASRAAALPGVHAVVTAADLPLAPETIAARGEAATSLKYQSANALAHDKALYKGHAVAAVAAVSPHVAEEALALVDVDYEVLPAVLDVREAMKPGSPILLEDLRTKSLGGRADSPSNVAAHHQYVLGDVERGFAEADVVVEQEFETSMVHQGYIEPQTATADWTADGQITVWCSTQGAFSVRESLAGLLDHPIGKIKVVPMEVGGGFGGKAGVLLEPIVALLSRKAGRPVKLAMSRAEVLQGSGPTSGTAMKLKMGATRDGRLTAATAELIYEAGAFPGSSVTSGIVCGFGPYDIPNARADGYDVVVNKPKTSAYRAPGAPQGAFAVESAVDEICRRLGMDPIEFRLKNAARQGTRRIDGPAHRSIGLVETLVAARACPHYSAPLGGPNRGRGVAVGYWGNWGGASACTINVNTDGTVQVVTGSVDLSGTRTTIAMQAAEVLGIPVEDVKPSVADTDSIGFADVSGGSRTTFGTGWAAYLAAQDVVRQMKERAAEVLEVEPAAVSYAGGVFTTSGDPDRRLTFKEVAGQQYDTGGPIVGRAALLTEGAAAAVGVHIADVEVDPETGKTQLLRYTVVQDVGKAVHPSFVEGQMQGGAVQGIGWALNEEYFFTADGQMANASLLDYRMPTAYDLPMIETVVVEVPNPGHPFGVRGVGEVPIVPPLATVANAVSRATDVRMARLPLSPNRVMEEIWRDGYHLDSLTHP
ncbi:MAG: xanthine dehydrogenase family protein molybdopterin-binding subunit [Chloroflexi bacterium]|nr:xanthine dehydrogenase family protein molybdopterin-binding subunit [Chloroflexota bacterium]